jgi:hypothetical protein
MRKAILQNVKATFLLAGFSTIINSAFSQQHVIADKNNTRDVTMETSPVATVTFFNAAKMNGFNEIQWTAVKEEGTRRYIIEYSSDGIDYRTAGEMVVGKGEYLLKHHILDTQKFLYRIKGERNDGKFFVLRNLILKGTEISPVKIYPTFVEGNTINVQLALPAERAIVYASNGSQVFAKELAGFYGTTQIVIPSLSKGTYLMRFYGDGWQSTSRFIIAR